MNDLQRAVRAVKVAEKYCMGLADMHETDDAFKELDICPEDRITLINNCAESLLNTKYGALADVERHAWEIMTDAQELAKKGKKGHAFRSWLEQIEMDLEELQKAVANLKSVQGTVLEND